MPRPLLIFCLLLSGGLLVGCEPEVPRQLLAPPLAPTVPAAIPPGAVRGDFDGDGRAEYVWLRAPMVDTARSAACVGSCTTDLVCSNPAIKLFALENAIGGTLAAYPHLDASGRDYVGVLPDWFVSCWRPYYLLAYRRGAWHHAVEPFQTYCDQWEDNAAFVERDPARAGYVRVRYSVFLEEGAVVKTKSVRLR